MPMQYAKWGKLWSFLPFNAEFFAALKLQPGW